MFASHAHPIHRRRLTFPAFMALAALLLSPLLAGPTSLEARQAIPHPADVLGFDPGEDYHLADHGQLTEYYRQLAAASDRVQMQEIGSTTRGLPMHLLFISTPENLAQLDRWREISRRLALARGLGEEEARSLAAEGKAIVWIDSGLHSTEVAHSQHAPLLAHHMATDESEETRRILENTVLLLMPLMNPDGHEIVVEWYRRNLDTPYETTGPPEIYHEYVGHDNNRDWFMITQAETRNVSRVLYEEWYPQIVFNHHQTGPFPARITLPPYAEPVNPHIHPQVVRGVNLIGSHMSDRLDAEGKSGALSYTQYDMWWNGGMRLAPYFHNMLGILVEVQHNSATPRYVDPEDLPVEFGTRGRVISATHPSIFYPNPWPGGWLTLRESVEYHLTTSLAVLDIASLRPDRFLYNIHQMGRQQIEAGEAGGPFAYVVPPDQWDRYEAVEMLNVFRRGGVEVHEATASFQAGGRTFPEGTHILHAGQAFRAHLMDLMEPQAYPERRLYPDGPPEPPYDLAGWTLPIQMGVEVVRVDEPFQASTREVADRVTVPPGSVSGTATFGWALTPRSNASAVAVNRLLAAGDRVARAHSGWTDGAVTHGPGTWLVEAGSGTAGRVRSLAQELGLDFHGLDGAPAVTVSRVRIPRIGVYRPWMDNIPEGWIRWILDSYEFAYETLRDADVREGDLSGFDLILLPAQDPRNLLHGHAEDSMPPEYVGGLGRAGTESLRAYVEAGGTVLALDGAGDVLMDEWQLPVRSTVRGVPDQDFFIPGSLLGIRVAAEDPVTWGMPEESSGTFVTRRGSQSRAFEVDGAGDRAQPLVSWAPAGSLLLSGWALGEDAHLAGRPAALRVTMGEGEVLLLGLRAGFRGQPRATFKLLFNPLYAAAMGGDTL
jgi:hypothetical protein